MVRKNVLAGLFISALLVMGFTYGYPAVSAEAKPTPAKTAVKNQDCIKVYYFYAKPRCISCKKIEAYTQEAVQSLNNPKVTYKAINLDEEANKHYAKEYNLYTKTVILSKIKNGKEVKSKNLTEIWTKLGDEKAFKDYIKQEIKNIGG